MNWIDSYLSTPYTQETRRTSSNAKRSKFQEGAWDLNQSWCYHIIHHTHYRSFWNLHLESTDKRIKDAMSGSPTHWRGWTCVCLHGKWMASQEPTWTARLPQPPTKSSLSWGFLFEGLMQDFDQVVKILNISVDTLWKLVSMPLVCEVSESAIDRWVQWSLSQMPRKCCVTMWYTLCGENVSFQTQLMRDNLPSQGKCNKHEEEKSRPHLSK